MGKLVKHTYGGVDMMLDHGTSVREERSTNMNRVVAGGRVVSGVKNEEETTLFLKGCVKSPSSVDSHISVRTRK